MMIDSMKRAGGFVACLYPICLISLSNPNGFGAWPYVFIGVCTIF